MLKTHATNQPKIPASLLDRIQQLKFNRLGEQLLDQPAEQPVEQPDVTTIHLHPQPTVDFISEVTSVLGDLVDIIEQGRSGDNLCTHPEMQEYGFDQFHEGLAAGKLESYTLLVPLMARQQESAQRANLELITALLNNPQRTPKPLAEAPAIQSIVDRLNLLENPIAVPQSVDPTGYQRLQLRVAELEMTLENLDQRIGETFDQRFVKWVEGTKAALKKTDRPKQPKSIKTAHTAEAAQPTAVKPPVVESPLMAERATKFLNCLKDGQWKTSTQMQAELGWNQNQFSKVSLHLRARLPKESLQTSLGNGNLMSFQYTPVPQE